MPCVSVPRCTPFCITSFNVNVMFIVDLPVLKPYFSACLVSNEHTCAWKNSVSQLLLECKMCVYIVDSTKITQ
jgi:hypothetical protein